MKKTIWLLLLFFLVCFPGYSSDLTDYLQQQPTVEKVELFGPNPFFGEAVRFFIRQPLDHKDPGKGSFLQRVFVSVRDRERPVILVTEGYAATYGGNPRYINELCPILDASQVVVEHRYFGESWPEERDWQYLSVENAAGDHHRVVMLLKPWFAEKWINTGISKGGQTALLHRMFFPGDVDLTVSYVAPMNFAVEDGRHERYIAREPGTREVRRKVKAFQKEVLHRRDSLMPLFEKWVSEKKFTFRLPVTEIFDYSVLEYSFSFWQWGRDPKTIPVASGSDTEIFNHWMEVSDPGYFSLEEQERMGSFFVQAARELGYYGYETRPFRKILKISTAKDYLFRLFLPDGYLPEFDPEPAFRTQRFLNTTNLPMLFIYGKDDPWTASGVIVPKKSAVLKVVQKGGSHRTRIASLSEENKQRVLEMMEEVVGLPAPALVPDN